LKVGRWAVDKNHLEASRFSYTNVSDVYSKYGGGQFGYWEEGDDTFKDHHWSAPCGFIKNLFAWNIPIGSTDQTKTSPEQPARSREACVSFRA